VAVPPFHAVLITPCLISWTRHYLFGCNLEAIPGINF